MGVLNLMFLNLLLLAISLFFGLWSSLHYFLAGKTIRREFNRPE